MRRLNRCRRRTCCASGASSGRVDEIVRRQTPRDVYLYFANKEDLFRALAVDVTDAIVDLAGVTGNRWTGPCGRRAASVDGRSPTSTDDHRSRYQGLDGG